MTAVHKNQGEGSALRALAGKYMTFKLGSEQYGLAILKVRELIGFSEITRVPRTPAFLRGVINLRGKVIPVADLRVKFGMPEVEPTSQSVIIVVQLSSGTMGVLVDEVLEVRTIEAAEIEPAPSFQGHACVDFILGVGQADGRIVFLLDIERVLVADEARSALF